MKKIVCFIAAICVVISLKAADSLYFKSMKHALLAMDSAKNEKEFIEVAQIFEQIAENNNEEWLPLYYSAYSFVIASYIISDINTKEHYINKAETMLQHAEENSMNNVEIAVLQAYLTNAKLLVNPVERGQSYGVLFAQQLEHAKELDKENPRIYYLEGQSVLYTPEMWGGGKDKALPILEEAMKKYTKFVPESEIHPQWGKEMCEYLLQQCKEK